MAKITSWPQEGVCSICKKETLVRVIIDGDKGFYVCSDCAESDTGKLSIDELIKKYGRKIKK